MDKSYKSKSFLQTEIFDQYCFMKLKFITCKHKILMSISLYKGVAFVANYGKN